MLVKWTIISGTESPPVRVRWPSRAGHRTATRFWHTGRVMWLRQWYIREGMWRLNSDTQERYEKVTLSEWYVIPGLHTIEPKVGWGTSIHSRNICWGPIVCQVPASCTGIQRWTRPVSELRHLLAKGRQGEYEWVWRNLFILCSRWSF